MKNNFYAKEREIILIITSIAYLLITFIIWNLNLSALLNINTSIYRISNFVLFLSMLLNIDQVLKEKKYRAIKPLVLIMIVLLFASLFIPYGPRARTYIFTLFPVFMLYVIIYQLNKEELIKYGFNSLLILFSIYNILAIIGAAFKFDYFFGVIPNTLIDNYRYSSILTNPNALGEFSFVGLWIGVYFFIKNKDKRVRLIYGSSILFSLLAIVISMSRTALLMTFVLFVILLIFSKEFDNFVRRSLYISIGVALLAILLLMAINFEFFKSLFRLLQGLTDREAIWSFVLAKIKENLLFGVGYGNGTMIIEAQGAFNVSQPHNLYLALLFEMGLFGFIATMIYIIVFTIKPLKFMKYSKNNNILLLMIFAFFTSFLIGQVFEFSLFKIGSLNTFIFVLIALTVTLISEVKKEGLYKPKVVHLITGLESGGAEAMLHKLMKYGNHEKFNYKVISMATSEFYGPKLEALGIEVITLNMNSKKHLLLAPFRLYKHIFKADVLQTWLYYANLLGLITAKLAFVDKVIWGIRQSDISSEHNKKGIVRVARLSKYISYFTDIILSNSDSTTVTHQDLGYYQKRFKTIYNGFEIGLYEPNQKIREEQRKLLGLKDEITFINVARYDIQKDHKMLFKALKLLKTKHKVTNFKLILIGKDIDISNNELVKMIEENDLSKEVILLGVRNNVHEILNAGDYFLLSSLGEGFPNVLGEAMAVGLIPVSTDVGDTKLIVGDAGIVVEKESPEKFSKAIFDITNITVKEKVVLKEKAVTRIKDNFDIKVITKACEDLYT